MLPNFGNVPDQNAHHHRTNMKSASRTIRMSVCCMPAVHFLTSTRCYNNNLFNRQFSSTTFRAAGRSQLRKLLDAQAAAKKVTKTIPATGAMETVSYALVPPSATISSSGFNSSNEYAEKLSLPGYSWNMRTPLSVDGPIGTHSGKFHCDEVLAVSMLKLLPELESRPIVRSRDPNILQKCAIVMDVGGEFDPPRHRYDHHQKSFTYSMRHLQPSKSWDIKLSSSGLIYCFFGRDIISQILEWSAADRQADIEKIYDKVYENFMQEIDAIDNGIKQTEREQQKYQITTNLSSRVSFFNPSWNAVSNPDTEMQQLEKAMELVRAEFIDRVKFYAEIWLPARAIVERAVAARFEVDPSGEIIMFNEGSCPWKEHLTDIEEEARNAISPIKLVVFSDSSAASWRVQGVPVAPHSFDLRTALPQAWRSLRDVDLQRVTGVSDAVFCHTNGFIGGAVSREGALKMAHLALEMQRTNEGVAVQQVARYGQNSGGMLANDGSADLKRQRI